jgi:hypothetical protein
MVTGNQPFDEETTRTTQISFQKWVTLKPQKV